MGNHVLSRGKQMRIWILLSALVTLAGTALFSQDLALSSDMSGIDAAAAGSSAPQAVIIVARPIGAAKGRASEFSWIDAFVHEYLLFRLQAINQIRIVDPDSLLAHISDYRNYKAGRSSDAQYRSSAQSFQATHILKVESQVSKGNSTVQFTFITLSAGAGGSETRLKSRNCNIDKIDEGLDSAITQLISELSIEIDQYGSKFLKTKIAGSGKCNKEIGNQVIEIYKNIKPNHKKAADELKKCALQDDGALLAYFVSNQEYVKAGDYENAAVSLKDLIFKLGPSYAGLYPIAARYFRLSDQLENALQMIKVCEGLGLSTNALVLEKAALFEAMEDESNTTRAYEDVLTFDPSNFNALLFLMHEYNKLSAPDRALGYATSFIQAYPSDGRGELEAGRAYLAQQQNSKAMTALTRAADMLPDDPAPHAMLGDLHIQNNSFTQALQEYERALELSGEDVDLHVKIGQTHLLMGKPQLALEKLKDLRKKYYDNMALLRVLGLSEYQTGDAAAARSDLVRYVENGPPDRSVYLALGELEEQDQQYGKAMQLYERAEALDRSDPAVLQHIAALKEKTGGAAVASHDDKHLDDAAYAPRRGSPLFTIGMLSGVICAGGAAGGFAMDWLLKKDYTAYQNEQNTDQVASLHKKIDQKKLYRNALYALAGASGAGLALTITIPLLR